MVRTWVTGRVVMARVAVAAPVLEVVAKPASGVCFVPKLVKAAKKPRANPELVAKAKAKAAKNRSCVLHWPELPLV